MNLVWEMWTRMGWCATNSHVVLYGDWCAFRLNEAKQEVIRDISHFNRLVGRPGFDMKRDFDDGWAYIIQIVATIQKHDLCFQASPEIIFFRQTVNNFSLYGIRRGMDSSSPSHLESFIFTARNGLFPQPIRYLHNREVDFLTEKTETIVTLQAASPIIDPMLYFEIEL